MKLLEDRIKQHVKVGDGNILKVDSFLNHQIDAQLLDEMGAEFERLYHEAGVTKILTIEASGIAIAVMAARHFGVPVVFAKKHKTLNIHGDVYVSSVESFTHKTTYDITVSKAFLNEGDRVLIVDDFLATGNALIGLIDLCRQAGAEVVGAGIAVEKAFQEGGKQLRERGLRVESLARVKNLSVTEGVSFVEDEE